MGTGGGPVFTAHGGGAILVSTVTRRLDSTRQTRAAPSLAWRERPRLKELLLTLRLLQRNGLVVFAIVVLVAFLLMAAFAPLFTPYDPYHQNLEIALQDPSLQHPFGTDRLGRDLLSRVIQGARLSFLSGIQVVLLATLIGVPVGLVSGYLGSKADEAMMRFTDIVLAFPGELLAIFLIVRLGPSLQNAILALGLVSWPLLARVTRGEVLREKEKDYTSAARALGKSDFKILFREILPNVWGPVIVTSTMNVGWAILATAALGFIGVGAQPPHPEWGLMISEGRDYLISNWYLSTLPGTAMFLVVLSLILFGDGLRDSLDPTLRHQ